MLFQGKVYGRWECVVCVSVARLVRSDAFDKQAECICELPHHKKRFLFISHLLYDLCPSLHTVSCRYQTVFYIYFETSTHIVECVFLRADISLNIAISFSKQRNTHTNTRKHTIILVCKKFIFCQPKSFSIRIW